LPVYRVVATLGEAHKQTFDVECLVSETGHCERGIGASRRAGEQAAATAMLQHLTGARPSQGPDSVAA
jgi:ribonuclease III